MPHPFDGLAMRKVDTRAALTPCATPAAAHFDVMGRPCQVASPGLNVFGRFFRTGASATTQRRDSSRMPAAVRGAPRSLRCSARAHRRRVHPADPGADTTRPLAPSNGPQHNRLWAGQLRIQPVAAAAKAPQMRHSRDKPPKAARTGGQPFWFRPARTGKLMHRSGPNGQASANAGASGPRYGHSERAGLTVGPPTTPATWLRGGVRCTV